MKEITGKPQVKINGVPTHEVAHYHLEAPTRLTLRFNDAKALKQFPMSSDDLSVSFRQFPERISKINPEFEGRGIVARLHPFEFVVEILFHELRRRTR